MLIHYLISRRGSNHLPLPLRNPPLYALAAISHTCNGVYFPPWNKKQALELLFVDLLKDLISPEREKSLVFYIQSILVSLFGLKSVR